MSANEIRRAAEIFLVLEFIHGIQPEAETDERQAEESKDENEPAKTNHRNIEPLPRDYKMA